MLSKLDTSLEVRQGRPPTPISARHMPHLKRALEAQRVVGLRSKSNGVWAEQYVYCCTYCNSQLLVVASEIPGTYRWKPLQQGGVTIKEVLTAKKAEIRISSSQFAKRTGQIPHLEFDGSSASLGKNGVCRVARRGNELYP